MYTTLSGMDDVYHQMKLFETFESVLDDPMFNSMMDRYGRNLLVADCQQLQSAIDRIMAKKRKPIRPTCKTRTVGRGI